MAVRAIFCICAANKDVATEAIQVSLLNACELGQVQMKKFVHNCIITQDNQTQVNAFRDPIKKYYALTFASLYEQSSKKTSDKAQIQKIDRTVFKDSLQHTKLEGL